MDDFLIKILLVVFGFLLGVSGQVIIQAYTEIRKRAAIRDLIRTEIQAFINSCDNAAKRKFWGSSTVENISRHIIQAYSNDRDRFIAIKSAPARQRVFDFYLEVSAYLSLIESHAILPKDPDGSSSAIGPGTYEGMVERLRPLLESLK